MKSASDTNGIHFPADHDYLVFIITLMCLLYPHLGIIQFIFHQVGLLDAEWIPSSEETLLISSV